MRMKFDQARFEERMALVPNKQTKMIEPNQMKSFRRNKPLLSELK